MPTSLGGVNIPIDYSTRDYEGYRQDCLDLVPILTPEWTDFYPADIGVVIVEQFSYIADNLSYYIDRAANESFLPSATQRRSVINHGKLVGYALSPATSAIVEVFFTVNAAGTIDAGDQVSTDPALTGEDAVVYEVKSDFVAPAAGTYAVECIQGESVTMEVLGDGTALPSQSYTLDRTPLSLDPSGVSSLQVYVDEGSGPVLYQEQPNFLSSQPTDRHYITQIDADDVVTVIFGTGVNGRLVAGGVDNVTASYRVGGGIVGNQVGSGQIKKYLGSNPIVTSVTNGSNIPQGGDDKESIEDAKVNIPNSFSTQDRAVTHADYEALTVAGVGGVAQAKAVWGIGPFEEVVYVAAKGSNPIATGTWDARTESGTGLLGQVGDYLKTRKASPVRLQVRPPAAVPIEIQFALELNTGFFQSEAQVEAREALLGQVEAARMGEDQVLSDAMCAIEELASVKKVRVSQYRRKPTSVLVNPDPFTVVGTPDTSWDITTVDKLDDTFSLTSAVHPTVAEVLTVEFINATQYRVTGSVTGLQSTLGTVGVLWTHDLGNLTLLATAGGIPNYGGNRYRITVGSGDVSTSIFVGEYEIATLADADITITSVTGGIK